MSPLTDDVRPPSVTALAVTALALGDPPVLLLDGLGLGSDPALEVRIERYLDSIRGRTTVIGAPYSAVQIQNSDQMVLIERGNVRHVGPTAGPALKVG